ncbi:SlyX family protein [Glaciimonas soli]|uniref:SlyX protein n=1 Tax=Glaciimonas soli TaxID=2590999 RepID=A0A843YK49_9BURK|nr:SlyX family protein [Glaciimonas soli]MQQ99764.1 SlyX protein [Glaciimonas soli]
MENRLIAIEIKVSRQEDLLDELNKLVYLQQKKIDQLETMCAALARHIKGMADNANAGGLPHERPPHY